MADELHLNGQPHPSPKEHAAILKAAASSVWVAATALGPAVNQVKQSTPTSNNLYWMYFADTKVIKTLVFKVTFKAGSPLTDQTQTFHFPSGYGGNTTTPFGVPYWGGNPILGPAVLTATADGVLAGTYHFTVIV